LPRHFPRGLSLAAPFTAFVKTSGNRSGAGLSYLKPAMGTMVPVLLEVDPQSHEPDIADDPDIRRQPVEQARGLADELFRSGHPRSKFEHAPSAD
jgi:hypothetical protein